MYSSSSDRDFYTSTILNTDSVCTYHLDTSSSLITGYDINITSISNACVDIYVEETSEEYTYKNTLCSSGDTYSVSISSGSYDDVFVVVVPSSTFAHANFTAGVISNSSTSTTYRPTTSPGLSGGLIAGIIVGSIVFIGLIFGFVIGLNLLFQCMRNRRNREQAEATNRAMAYAAKTQADNQQNAMIMTPQPVPSMMQPQPVMMQPQPVYDAT